MHLRIAVTFVLAALAATALQVRQVQRLVAREPAGGRFVGRDAPALEAGRPDGSRVYLTDYTGKVVIVSFWASWCLPCRVEMPRLARFASAWNRDGTNAREVVLVAVNLRERSSELRHVLEDPRYAEVVFAFDADGSVARRWGVRGLPWTVVVDPNGRVREVLAGHHRLLEDRLGRVLGRYRG